MMLGPWVLNRKAVEITFRICFFSSCFTVVLILLGKVSCLYLFGLSFKNSLILLKGRGSQEPHPIVPTPYNGVVAAWVGWDEEEGDRS